MNAAMQLVCRLCADHQDGLFFAAQVCLNAFCSNCSVVFVQTMTLK
jgi:hypothetical protein